MKLSKYFTIMLVFGFILGIGLAMTAPTSATAGSVPDLCASQCGNEIVCYNSPECGVGAMYKRCSQWNPPTYNCTAPWTCGCVDLGCGPECEIE